MELLTPTTAAEYLRATNYVDRSEPLEIHELAGGVSNVTLHVHRPAVAGGFLKRPRIVESDFVLKQARSRLAVAVEWLCDPARIEREIDVLHCLGRLLNADPPVQGRKLRVPRVLFEDRAHFLFAMSAAPPDHKVWKSLLLAGQETEEARRVGRACGDLLARIHGRSWNDCDIAAEFGESTYFEDLRVDPYYRYLARNDASLGPAIDDVIVSLAQHRLALVHGDFSPKNLLVDPGGLMLIDCEVGHFGDPAFDLGFFQAHLILKAFRAAPGHAFLLKALQAFDHAYAAALRRIWSGLPGDRRVGPERQVAAMGTLQLRAQRHLGACLLARLAGKSPVDYLVDPQRRAAVERLGRTLLCGPALAVELDGWQSLLAPALDPFRHP